LTECSDALTAAIDDSCSGRRVTEPNWSEFVPWQQRLVRTMPGAGSVSGLRLAVKQNRKL
jgi:hypothetical protein